ncbi:MAG: arginine repressor [Clostridia bacterium]|nr:arginine repressor [Clostridia bacterium]
MKLNRHQKILELIKLYPINTQEELLLKLRAEGYTVTQSTVSRDIKSLRLQKALLGDGNYRYIAPEGKQSEKKSGFSGILTSSVVSAEAAVNLVVVKTYSGMAGAACAAIDSIDFAGVVGSLAGDDTIFIACKDNDSAKDFVLQLNKLL